METLSLFDVLKKLQLECYGDKSNSRSDKIVVLDYEDSKYIFCDDLKKKFPTWKSAEIEEIGGTEYLTIYSDSIYYMWFTEFFSSKDKLREYFSLKV